MSISYPISLPVGIVPSAFSFGYMTNTKTNASPFTFSTQRLESYGQAWSLKLTFPPLNNDQARLMASFMTQLKGQLGSFYFSPPNASKVTGSGTVSLVSIDNDLRNSITINTGGVTISNGSYVQIGEQLVQFQNDISGASASVSIFPMLRSAVTPGTSVIYTNPQGKFSLTQNTQQWSGDARTRHTDFTLDAIESL